MVGRRSISEAEAIRERYADGPSARRRAVLRETIAAFERAEGRYHRLAAENLARTPFAGVFGA
jgi:hypothetical protein